jgi:hypothetical protein
VKTCSIRVTAACLALVIHLGGAAGVRAGWIRDISTGYNNQSGTVLPNGTADTDYVIGPGGTGGRVGEIPLVRTAPIPNTWLPDGASSASRWLILPGTGLEGITVLPGTYFFDTVVDLTGFDPATAQINGLRYAADNKLVGVRVNGTAVFTQNLGFAEEFQSFRDLGNLGSGLFHSGLNLIRFEVFNDLFGTSPLGVRVEGRVEGLAVATPEPPTLLLGGLGALFCAAWVVGFGKSDRRIGTVPEKA